MTDVASEAPAVGRRERKKNETKRRIFEAALKLFHEKGIAATTIDDITEAADVAKGTFFNYFPRKESVVEYIAEEWMEEIESAVNPRHTASQRIVALYQAAAGGYDENPNLAPLVMRAAMERFCCPDPGGAWQRFEQLVVDTVKAGQESGEFKTDLEPHAIYGVLGSCFIGSLIWWLGPRQQMEDPHARETTLRDVVRLLQQTALGGIRARGGSDA